MATWDQQVGSALKGTPTGPGEPTPLYDPTSKKFIGWQMPKGGYSYAQDTAQGRAPDWYPGGGTAAPAAVAAAAPATPAPSTTSYGATPTRTTGDSSGMANVDAATAQAYFAQARAAAGLPPGQTDDATALQYYQAMHPQAAAASDPTAPAAPAQQPESIALQQMQQIDPGSEALRTALAQSYLTPLNQAGAPTLDLTAKPSAQTLQSYLDLFKSVDPEEYAQRAGLATSMDSYLKSAQAEAALGSQLDPVTARQVEQQTRAGQIARGNVYGTPQMVEEAMTTGQAGMALKQQRQQALASALGGQQSYLGAGLGLGDTALGLYNTNFSQNMQTYQQRLAALQAAQGGALSYLGSGQTPYQAGNAFVQQAYGNAANAAQGGPVYNPASLGTSYSGSATAAPQYGLNTAQNANSWYNSLAAYSGGQGGGASKNKMMGATAGAIGGAASGAIGGAAAGGVGAIPGALIGAVGGGAAGYFS